MLHHRYDIYDFQCVKMLYLTTLPETNIAPENRPSQQEMNIPTIHFQGRAVSFREGILHNLVHPIVQNLVPSLHFGNSKALHGKSITEGERKTTTPCNDKDQPGKITTFDIGNLPDGIRRRGQ